jgi:hypothetical protein
MMRPGVDVISRALPPPRSAPTDTGVCFIVGATTTTDVAYDEVHSLTEYVAVFGDRGTAAPEQATYDAADAYFREGGSKLIVAPTTYVGTFSFVEPTKPDDDTLEKMSRAELDALAVEFGLDPTAYATKSDVVDAIKSAPGVRAADPGITTALAALTADLGPGQILIADATLAAVVDNQSALLAHAANTNRVALLSCADGDAAALTAAGTALQSDANARYGALFAPSAILPGVVAGTTRIIPYSAVEAGIIARNDVAYTPNQPAAGVLGQTVYTLDVNGRYSDLDYQNLNEAGVNMARVIYGGVRTYGYRSCVDPDATPQWLDFGWCRLNMGIVAEADAIGESYVFAQLDGKRRTIGQFGGELSAMLSPFYDAGALYGPTPQDAFDVDVGTQVNTEETIANGELHALISVCMSGMAEWVVIEIVKVATNQTLPATALAVAA